MSTQAGVVETTTSLVLHEKGKLIKSLRRFDMVFFTVCAVVAAPLRRQAVTTDLGGVAAEGIATQPAG